MGGSLVSVYYVREENESREHHIIGTSHHNRRIEAHPGAILRRRQGREAIVVLISEDVQPNREQAQGHTAHSTVAVAGQWQGTPRI